MADPTPTLPASFLEYLRALEGKRVFLHLAGSQKTEDAVLHVHGDYVTLEGRSPAIAVAHIAWVTAADKVPPVHRDLSNLPSM